LSIILDELFARQTPRGGKRSFQSLKLAIKTALHPRVIGNLERLISPALPRRVLPRLPRQRRRPYLFRPSVLGRRKRQRERELGRRGTLGFTWGPGPSGRRSQTPFGLALAGGGNLSRRGCAPARRSTRWALSGRAISPPPSSPISPVRLQTRRGVPLARRFRREPGKERIRRKPPAEDACEMSKGNE